MRLPVDVVPGRANGFAVPLPLSRIDRRDRTPLPLDPVTRRLTADIAVASGSFAGVALDLASGTRVLLPPEAPAEFHMARLTLGEIPVPPLAGVYAEFAYEIGPPGTRLPDGARLRLPNTTGLAPGSAVPIYHLDAEAGGWVLAGSGTVAVGGTEVVSDGAIVRSLSPYFIPSPSPETTRVTGKVALLLPDGTPIAAPDPRLGGIEVFVLGRSTRADDLGRFPVVRAS
jgi:hypothetical protein